MEFNSDMDKDLVDVLIYFFLKVLEMKYRASYMLGKCPTTELQLQHFCSFTLSQGLT